MMTVQSRIRMNNLIIKIKRNQDFANELKVKDVSILSNLDNVKLEKVKKERMK